MLRVSISGTHSVGKTVLANNLSKELSEHCQVALLPEVARILIKRRFKMNQDVTEFGILNYALEYLRVERETRADIVISDRSIIDLLAYITVNQSRKVRKEIISIIGEIVWSVASRNCRKTPGSRLAMTRRCYVRCQ